MQVSNEGRPGGRRGERAREVAVGEHYLVVIQRTSGVIKRRRLDVTSCQPVKMRHGLIVEVSGLYSADRLAEIDAFGYSTAGVAARTAGVRSGPVSRLGRSHQRLPLPPPRVPR